MCVAILKLMESRTEIVLVTICCRDRTGYVFIYMASSDPVDTRVPPLLVKEAIGRIIWLFQATKRQEVTRHFPQSILMQKFSLHTLEKLQL